jgi:hypothetical protein
MGVDNLDRLSFAPGQLGDCLVSDRPDHCRRGHELLWQEREECRTHDGEDNLWRPGLGQYRGWAPDSKRFAWTAYETLPEQGAK